MCEHTKGPWKIRKFSRRIGIISGHATVAMVEPRWHDCTSEANAHLISAAPDMYEAIAGALRIADLWFAEYANDEHAGETEALSNMMSNFKKAIAKAEGREE